MAFAASLLLLLDMCTYIYIAIYISPLLALAPLESLRKDSLECVG